MHNKFVIVLALLITISMANKLEFKSEDDEYDFKKTYEEFKDFGYLDRYSSSLGRFIKKIAVLAASNASFIDKENIIRQYENVSNDIKIKIRENDYFAARDLIAAESRDEALEAYAKPIFAYYYINTLLQQSNSAITLEDIALLYA